MGEPDFLLILGGDVGCVQLVFLKSECPTRFLCSSASSSKKKNSWQARHSYTLDSNMETISKEMDIRKS